MIAVIFEVTPTKEGKEEYLSIAANLKKYLSDLPGFISIERFQSLSSTDKILSLSFWENEESISNWRNFEDHISAQIKGRNELFSEYRIRVCNVVRDYTLAERAEAPNN